MELINLPIKKKKNVLALGAESAGIFAFYRNGQIFISDNFGDLLDENSFEKYKKAVLNYLQKEKIKLDIILTDLHPLYKTTILGEELSKNYNIPRAKVQHHIAHIFSAVGDKIIFNTGYPMSNPFFGFAMDGTGYGLDGNIWGGEVLQITKQLQNQNFKIKAKNSILNIKRIGSLEEQIMIGGDLAVREPARMLISILDKLRITNYELQIKSKNQRSNFKKEFIYNFVKKFYTRNEFEALYNQMEQNFNCQITTSAGRVLDAVAVLLGFAGNERNYKHQATKLLEENSTKPYDDLDLRFKIYDLKIVLDTTHLFKYLIKNIKKDKKRLAATAQAYIASGLYKIIKKNYKSVFAAGGVTNNKIISSYFKKQGVYLAKKIPRGDEGIAIGQIIFYLTNSWH